MLRFVPSLARAGAAIGGGDPSRPTGNHPVSARTWRQVVSGFRGRFGVLPGFAPSLAITLFGLVCMVFLPFAALSLKAAGLGWHGFWETVLSPRALAALRLSFGGALVAAGINTVFGLVVAWMLVREPLTIRWLASLIDALVDLPLALPTAVAGIALTAIYAPEGPLGRFAVRLGWPVAFAPPGVVIAMVFVGLPLAVRSVQPVLEDLDLQAEEAAATLGASRWQTFWRVIVPALLPSLATGFSLAFARAVGEYGSVVFISGNMPLKTEIVPLLIVTKLEQYEEPAATALGLVMLLGSFAVLAVVNALQAWQRRRGER